MEKLNESYSNMREEKQDQRMEYAISKLKELGVIFHHYDKTTLKFMYAGSEVIFYPFTGWHTGKSIKDGRGIQNLLKQLKPALEG